MPSFPRLLRVLSNPPVLGTAFSSTLLLLSCGVSAAATVNQPPTATSVTVTTKEDSKAAITLKGVDPEKKKLTYALVSQPSHGTVVLAGSKATYIPAANYFNTATTPDSFTFKVNDGTQDSVPATVKVVVTSVNDVPTAQNASASTVQDTAVDIALIGSDVEGDPLTYVPSKSKKGGTVVVKSGNTVTYTPKKGYLGVDSFTFTAKDNNKGVSKAATVSITVAAKPQNLLPTANAGVDQTLNEKTLVTLDGSGSKDSDGTLATYAWKQTAGTTVALTGATTAKPTFTAPDIVADTTLTFELTVTDNKGAVAKDTVNIAVKNIANLSPTANAGVDQTLNEKTLVTLDGSGSKDSDGTIATYAWKQTAGTTVVLTGATTAKPTFTAPDVAADTTLTFELTVTDNKGAIAKDTVNSAVKNIANLSPTANAGTDRTLTEKTLVTLDGSASTDSDGTIVSYAWKQITGVAVALSSTSVDKPTFTAPDVTANTTLVFELTVTDNKGATTKDTVNIFVQAEAIIIGKLNDTGITHCAQTYSNSTCPQVNFPGQDAETGRDANQATNTDVDGHRGFNFTKISSTGVALPASATEWSCVKDNVTGLIWEVKTDDGGLHDKDWRYTWYEPDSSKNGGNAGTQNGDVCGGTSQCDTYSYVQAVNNANGWCGASDWRMPTVSELFGIVSLDRVNQSIDTNYFPNSGSPNWYEVFSIFWSSSPVYLNFGDYAWSVDFQRGFERSDIYKNFGCQIRLVRSE